jgi:putative transposase
VNLIHSCLKRLVGIYVSVFCTRFVRWTKPLTSSLPHGTLADLTRSKPELMAENALLRQQLIILKRQVKRPACTNMDRMLLVLLARAVRAWKQTLLIVQPETLLRWHRELFRLYWKRRSKASSHKPKVAAETIALIREMATENRLWGAERIRGEVLKLGIRVCKRTIQKYMRTVRTHQPRGQKWATFVHNHAADIWACDFLQVTDLFFRPLAGVLHHRTHVTESDPRRSDKISDRSLGCAYRSEKLHPMGKHRSI